MSNSNSSRPQFPADTSSFTTSMHHALESITSRDDEISAVRPADMEVKSSNLPRGGLYTTWEGAMPADGVRRKPVPVSEETATYYPGTNMVTDNSWKLDSERCLFLADSTGQFWQRQCFQYQTTTTHTLQWPR